MKKTLKYFLVLVSIFTFFLVFLDSDTAEATENNRETGWEMLTEEESEEKGLAVTPTLDNSKQNARYCGAGYGQVTVTKYDGQTGAVLAGAAFTIYNSRGTAIQTITTDAYGYAQAYLPYGNYQIAETKAPNGYKLETTKFNFTLSSYCQSAQLKKCNEKLPVEQKGYILITKVDTENKLLQGAEFLIKKNDGSGQVVATVKTDANGTAVVPNLPFGSYQVKETVAPAGYELVNTTYTVNVYSTTAPATLRVVNQKIVIKEGTVKITKVSESGTPLAGAEFTIFNPSGQEVDKITSGSDGIATSKNLPYDQYIVYESKAPAGYLPDGSPKFIIINDDHNPEKLKVVNKKQITTGSIRLIKHAKDSETVLLKGAKFRLFDSKKNAIAEGETNEFGEIIFPNLEPGDYTISEISPPPGYESDYKIYPVTVTVGKEEVVRVPNTMLTYDIQVKTTIFDDATEAYNPLANAVYELFDDKGVSVKTGKSDGNGIIHWTDLPAGEYTVTLKELPDPDILDITDPVTPEKIIVSSDTAKAGANGKTLELEYKHLYKGGFFVFILNSSDTNKKLSNLNYQIVNLDNPNIFYNVKTNYFGQISKNLPVGRYQIYPVEPGGMSINGNTETGRTDTQEFVIEHNKLTYLEATI